MADSELTIEQRVAALEEKSTSINVVIGANIQTVVELKAELNRALATLNTKLDEREAEDIAVRDKFAALDNKIASIETGYSKSVLLLRGGLGFNVQQTEGKSYAVLAFEGTAFVDCLNSCEQVTLPSARALSSGRMIILRGNNYQAVTIFGATDKDRFIRKGQYLPRTRITLAKNEVLRFVALGRLGALWIEV